MEKIKLSYNTYNKKYIVLKNNEEISANDSWLYKKNQELELWVNGFAKRLFDYINDDIILTFKGYEEDYELLQKEIEIFNSSQKDGYIELSFKKLKSYYYILEELKDLFNYMQDTSPFDELRAKKLKEIFERGECEVAVISTMSSGKSTLLNALLGRELMPSKNAACTATIARIKDVDGAYGFNAKCLDENENIVVEEVKNVSADTMSSFNENESVSYIDVEGDIPFVESHDIQLVLLDTPGPNTRDHKHREKIYSLINESDSLVLYVLNATQLGSIDDNLLLSYVSKAMEKSGKQAKDRFMFVVNKLDDYDLENGDSIKKAYNDIVSYLKSHEIVDPNIYFISAKAALITRLIKNNYPVTKKQNREFEAAKELFEEFEELHLSKYASLSKRGHDKINTMLNNAEDELDTLLVHSGVPAVEIAINEYLEKYVVPEKIKQTVNIVTEEINKIKSNIDDSTVNKYWLDYIIARLNNILEI